MTKMEATPAFRPHWISVYIRSPTTAVSPGAAPFRAMARRTMAVSGLPRTLGRRPVALYTMAQTLPQSGTEPNSVGHTRSGLVAR